MSFCEQPHENGEQNFSQIEKSSESNLWTSKATGVKENFVRKSSSTTSLPATSPRTSTAQAEEKALPDIVRWRRAEVHDMPAIRRLETLTGDVANLLYRKSDIDELIDSHFLTIVQFDSKDDLISFTAYDSYPDIPSLSIVWDDWISLQYRFDDVSPRNVLFIHYMLWLPEQANKFLPLLLETLFSEFVHVKHIIVVKPPNAVIPDFYRNYFIPILPPSLSEFEYDSIQSILVCLKTSIIRPVPIRSAFDYELEFVLSVINNHFKTAAEASKSSSLDLINFIYQKEKKTLLCELEGQLAGIMMLNLKIDLDLLNEGFELAPFNGLRKKNFLDQTAEFDSPSVSKRSSTKTQEYPNLLISSEFLFSQMNWEILLSKLKASDTSSYVLTNENTASYSSENEFSQFSLVTLSPPPEKSDSKKNETDSGATMNRGKNDFIPKTGDVKVAFRTSGIAMTHFFSPKYHGQSNAFVIDFFAIDCNKIDEKLSSFDFLEAAFEKVPDREYCVLIIPTDFLPFPLLDLFVRVTPRPMSTFKQELYLCHKKSLSIISMCVRSTEEEDLADINYFLRPLDEGGAVYQDILNNCFMDNKDFKSYVLTAEKKIVGVSLINCQDSAVDLHKYFNVADLIAIKLNQMDNGSTIKHLIINPKYKHHARFFLRDIMRLADVHCLYYVNSKSPKADSNVVTVLEEFYPVKPKRKAGLDGIRLLFSSQEKCEDSFSLYFMNPRLCGIGKMHMNIVIVVVGASRTSLAFLRSLIFGPDNTFFCYNNLICVTPHGLEAENDQQNLNLMFPIRDNFSRQYASMLSLETYVNFIYGVMTGINRSEKYIVVNNKEIVRYDYLILTCGLQYLSPTPKNKESTKNRCNKNLRSNLARFLLPPSPPRKLYIPKHPVNMFIINTNHDAQNAIRTLQYLFNKVKNVRQTEKKIIVYGHDLHVFLTIHTLLKLGIPGDFIVFVEPFPANTTTVTLFNDYCVDQAVLESVKECKVSCYMEYFLYDWTVGSDDYITAITFHSRRKQIVIPCLAFFPFLEKLVSDVTYNACNDAGLVYDGRLVINHNFRTNDSCIYAAGPFTKYAKRYFANDRNHQYYNSTEVGQKLAEIIREKIDPMTRAAKDKVSDLVPLMKAPVFLHCQLPGDFNFFVLRKPGKPLDLETAYNFINYGEVLTTGDCKMKKGYGYFRLHLDSEGFVQSITCYTKDKIDYVSLSSLYGLHEKFLNNLLFRYDMSLISDFFDYFRQPWALALFHEDFQLLRDYNVQTFYQRTSNNENFCNEVVQRLRLNGWQSLSGVAKKELEENYLYSRVEEEIKNNLLQFLEYYNLDLPVYATPSKVEHFTFEKAEPRFDQ